MPFLHVKLHPRRASSEHASPCPCIRTAGLGNTVADDVQLLKNRLGGRVNRKTRVPFAVRDLYISRDLGTSMCTVMGISPPLFDFPFQKGYQCGEIME